MSKKKKITPAKQSANNDNNLEQTVMARIEQGKIAMKPKWFFVLGSLLLGAGLMGLSMATIFLLNLTLYYFKKRGPGMGRLELMLANFPWWIPILALIGVVVSVWLLRKYDFSYKKNFWLIVAIFLVAILLAAGLVDQLGLNEIWSRRGPMRRLYQHSGRQYNNFNNFNELEW